MYSRELTCDVVTCVVRSKIRCIYIALSVHIYETGALVLVSCDLQRSRFEEVT